MIKVLEYAGFTYSNCTVEQLLAYGVPQAAIAAAENSYKWSEVRALRDAALSGCDYAVMPDSPLSVSEVDAVKGYRQALRDLPEQGSDPDAVAWPDKPACLK